MDLKLKYVFICCAIVFAGFQCQKQSHVKTPVISHHEETPLVAKQNDTLTPAIKYRLIYVKENRSWLDSLEEGELNTLLSLNRVDKEHLLRQDSIIVPDAITEDINVYSPFPESLEQLNAIKKILFISYYDQAFAAYENGIRKRWGPTSLGKELTPTTQGLYFTNWKKKKTRSTENWNWILRWYFNIENFRGISIHEFALPGYPASHACIRLLKEDAFWIYHWADQWILDNQYQIAAYGTPVIVFGDFPFGQRKPWFDLVENGLATRLSRHALLHEVERFLQLILDRQTERDSVLHVLKSQ